VNSEIDMKVLSPAKINLTLEILGRKENQYHEISSIMQTLDLFDEMSFNLSSDISVTTDNEILSNEQNNLSYKAAKLLKDSLKLDKGVHISIKKKIPIAAGLGGGSSNAATTLICLNKIWDLNLSVIELSKIGSKLGSDIPFFLTGGTALVSGQGEAIRELPMPNLPWFLIISPNIKLENKTSQLYKMVESSHFTSGALTRKLEARIRGGGDVPPQFFFNVFDKIAPSAFQEITLITDELRSLGLREVHLCGSGPALFCPIERKEMATAIKLIIERKLKISTYLTTALKTYSGSPNDGNS